VVNCRKEKEKSRRVTIVNESRRAPRRLVDWSCESARISDVAERFGLRMEELRNVVEGEGKLRGGSRTA